MTSQKKDHFRYLGFLLDNNLTLLYHIEKVRSKVVKGIWAIARLRNLVSTKVLLNVYYSLLFTHLNYCILLWGSAAKTALLPLHILQKKAARLITNQNYTAHANPLFKKLKLLTIKDVHKLEVAKYMFKMIQLHSGTTSSLFTTLSSLHHYYTRNSTTNFFTKRSNTDLGKKSKQILGARVWWEVPDHIKDLTFSSFVKKYKQYLISKYE